MHTCAFAHKGAVEMHNASDTLVATLFMHSRFLFDHVMRKTNKGAMARKTEYAHLRLKLMTKFSTFEVEAKRP